ncbi:hypothetical protein CWI37_0267p0010, partial [Hamiltosporidium tvaerminnensis]
MVKNLISKIICENMLEESVFQLLNDDLFQNIGQTSLCRWSNLLKRYDDNLLSYSRLYFNRKIQSKMFETPIKFKLLYIFKILILILKHTSGHELYELNHEISVYMYSYDLDISYYSRLFYNEYFSSTRINSQDCIYNFLKQSDSLAYLERNYKLTVDAQNKKISCDFTYEKYKDKKILLEIGSLVLENRNSFKNDSIFEIQSKITNFTSEMAEILKYEYFKNTELQKLLALDILLTNILLKLCHNFNENIIECGIIFFIYSDINEFLTDALYISFHILLYHNQSYDKILFNSEIDYHINNFAICENISKENGFPIKEIFMYNFLFLLKDFVGKDLTIIDNEIQELIITKSFRIDKIYQKMNLIIQRMLEQETLQIHIDEINLNIFMSSFETLIDALILFDSNNSFFTKIIEEESFDSTIMNTFWFLGKLSSMNVINNFDLENKIVISFSESLIKLLENEKHFNRDLMDIIISDALACSIIENLEKHKIRQMNLIDKLFEYYFTENTSISSLTFDNIYSLIKITVKLQINEFNVTIVDNLIKFFFTNIEFSLLLYKENLKLKFENRKFINILNSIPNAMLNLDYMVKYISNENNYKIIDLDLFNIYKSSFYADKYVEKLHKYFEDKDKTAVDIFLYYELHLKNLLGFLNNLLKSSYLSLVVQSSNYIDQLIRNPENLFFSRSKIIIWDIAKHISQKTSASQDTSEFFDKFLAFTLDKVICNSLSKNHYNSSSEIKISKLLCYFIDFFVYFNENFKYICEIRNPLLKKELYIKLLQIFKIIYSEIICSIDISSIKTWLIFKEENLSNENIKNIFMSQEITIKELFELCYVSLLNILPKFGLQYTQRLFNSFIPQDTPYVLEINHETRSLDLNLFYMFYFQLRYNFLVIDSFFNEIFDMFCELSNFALKYSKKHEIYKKDTYNIILKSFELFMFGINKMNRSNQGCYSAKKILKFINDNIEIFSANIFMDIFTNKIMQYPNLRTILSDINLFETISNIIHKIDKNSLKSLNKNNKIERKTLLYKFLHFSLFNLKYSKIFINGQTVFESLFLFVFYEINENTDVLKKFILRHSVTNVTPLYNILISNINININKEKKLSYRRENLLLFLSFDNNMIEESIFLYLISLVRLSDYSNIFKKMEIYQIYGFKKGISLITDKKYSLEVKNNFLNYFYLYLRFLLEDDLYFLYSLIYISRNYNNFSESVFQYFYSKLIIYESHTSHTDFLLDESNIDLKKMIVLDVFDATKVDNIFIQIVSLQFLTEIIYTFPYLIYIINYLDIMNTYYKKMIYHVLDDKFCLENQEIWYLNFKVGYFFTILLYRLDEEFMSKLVENFCKGLRSSDVNEVYSMITFIYKLFLSEICCCRYSHNIIFTDNNFYDLNCENNFFERRLQIVGKFMEMGLLIKLISVYNMHEFMYFYVAKIIDFVFNLAKNKKYILRTKFLTNNAFSGSSSSKNMIFIPNFLGQVNLHEIEQVEFDINGTKQRQILLNVMNRVLFRLDFGFKTRNHLIISKYRFAYSFMIFNAQIQTKKYDFGIEEIDSIALFTKKFDQEFDKLKFMKKISEYNLSNLTLKDLAGKIGLENFIEVKNNKNQQNLQNESLVQFFMYSKGNIKSSLQINNDFTILETYSKFIKTLDAKQLSYIFSYLLFRSEKNYYILSINILKNILRVCTKNKMMEEFYSCFVEIIKSFKTYNEDKIVKEKLKTMWNIVEGFDLRKVFENDFFIVEVLIITMRIVSNDKISNFDGDSDFRILFDSIFDQRSDSSCSSIDYLIKNIHEINSKCTNLGFYIAIELIFIFTKMMENSILNLLINSTDSSRNSIDNFYLQGLEKLICSLDNFFIEMTSELIDFIHYYLIQISDILLQNIFTKFLEIKNIDSEYFFDLYIKLIIKNSSMYLNIREAIFENQCFEMKRLSFIYNDFLCLVFDISNSNFVREIRTNHFSTSMYDLYYFFEYIYKYKQNKSTSLDLFPFININTKLLICKTRHLISTEFKVFYIIIEVERRYLLNSTLCNISSF